MYFRRIYMTHYLPKDLHYFEDGKKWGLTSNMHEEKPGTGGISSAHDEIKEPLLMMNDILTSVICPTY